MKDISTILFLLVLILAACSPVSTPAVPAEAPAEATPVPPDVEATQALFHIIRADGTTFDVTLEAVKSLPLAQISVEGKVEEGPKLLDILALAGITEFSEVSIRGSSSPCRLTRDQVDDNSILDFTNRGTMKLATTHIPKADWTKDVSEITVK